MNWRKDEKVKGLLWGCKINLTFLSFNIINIINYLIMNKTTWLDYWTTNSSIWYTANWEEIKIINLNNGSLEDRTALFYDFEEKNFTI